MSSAHFYFFCVFLERVVGKLSKPLSGHNSKIHVASTAGLIFIKHSLLPAFFFCFPPPLGLLPFHRSVIWKLEDAMSTLTQSTFCGLPAEDVLSNRLCWSLELNVLHQVFSASALLAFGGHRILLRGEGPMLSRVFSNIPRSKGLRWQ